MKALSLKYRAATISSVKAVLTASGENGTTGGRAVNLVGEGRSLGLGILALWLKKTESRMTRKVRLK